MTIASSSFYSNEAVLTLANGASLLVLSADRFTYRLGANTSAGDSASNLSYTQFGTLLGASVPTSGILPVSGTANYVVPGDAAANTGVPISTDGSSSAASADQTFNLALANYTHTITGFANGDKLDFPSGNVPSISNDSHTDGMVDLTFASVGLDFKSFHFTISLTGLASSIDQQLNNVADFDLVFGVGTIF